MAKDIIQSSKDQYSIYMMELVENLPRFSKDSARYLKYMAAFIKNGIHTTLSPWTFLPELNYCRIDWQMFDVLGKGLYYGQLTKDRVTGILTELNGEKK
jgi:hypothetical protein